MLQLLITHAGEQLKKKTATQRRFLTAWWRVVNWGRRIVMGVSQVPPTIIEQ
ncbi:hypothetical protein [Gloeothece citriformis]|uniref:hypothetical protein n=1 Tax=Gloeothece citriformis TaxID=2546356 RepID=UPI0003087EF6|nr:hypothetical protein [Gloeothece citriformis]